MAKSVVLLSGGLDSAVNLGMAVRETEVRLALTADYAQRAATREIAAARALCRHYAVKHRVVNLRWLGDLSDTPLTRRDRPLPDPRAVGSEAADAAVWIPNRNGVLMNVAAAYAEALGAERVVAGFNAEEAAAFPDNSPEYLAVLNRCFRFSTRTGVEAFSYTADVRKAGVVALARQHGVPLERVWFCYGGGEAPCWRCGSCVRFRAAVQAAGCGDWLASRGLILPSE